MQALKVDKKVIFVRGFLEFYLILLLYMLLNFYITTIIMADYVYV